MTCCAEHGPAWMSGKDGAVFGPAPLLIKLAHLQTIQKLAREIVEIGKEGRTREIAPLRPIRKLSKARQFLVWIVRS